MAAEAAGPLARQALELVKNELLVSLRFMNAAFSRLALLPAPGSTLATDGAHLRYDPAGIARAYADDPAALARAYLHIVLHNVFLHPFPGTDVDAVRWDAACDIAVEKVIADLNLPATRTAASSRQLAALARIDAALPLVTAETVYRHLLDRNLDDHEVEKLRAPFFVDDHAPWHRMAAEEAARDASRAEGHRDEGERHAGAEAAARAGKNGIDMDVPQQARDAKKSRSSHGAMDPDDIMQKDAPEEAHATAAGRFADTVTLDRARDQWKNVAYEMGVQLDSYIKLWGIDGANLSMGLKAVTRERQDYREFLRKFARMGEQIRVNDDEFDYVYYCYGLTRYGNLPLIEPLEYVEEKRIRDFVIAIDTSASTKDGLVRRFIEKTYAILAEETSFFADMNVLIVQCDAAVTDVARIANLDDLNDYLDNLEIRGLGGTDFRPVFSYVDNALDQGDLVNLGGLIYFTDGQGTYPARKPDYDVAFAFVDNLTAQASPTVPPWAMKVVLEETAIMQDESALSAADPTRGEAAR
ncbi:MAG TPA: hypothetical protein H9823_07085 [Candidatus Rubneribacter avistercoris]|nr:hypothetical protein [Candidatus Rubneribacter avistercoris]